MSLWVPAQHELAGSPVSWIRRPYVAKGNTGGGPEDPEPPTLDDSELRWTHTLALRASYNYHVQDGDYGPATDDGSLVTLGASAGIHRARTAIVLSDKQKERVLKLWDDGAGVAMGFTTSSGESAEDKISWIERNLPPHSVAWIEGKNEVDGGTGNRRTAAQWAEFRADQQALYNRVKDSRVEWVSKIPVGSFSLAFVKGYQTINGDPRDRAEVAGDLSGMADWLNVHNYWKAHPVDGLQAEIDHWRRFQDKENMDYGLTESGGHTKVPRTPAHYGRSEESMAFELPIAWVSNHINGAVVNNVYEFLDEHTGPGAVDTQSHFGAIKNRGPGQETVRPQYVEANAKLHFHAGKRFHALMNDPGAKPTINLPTYSVSPRTGGVKHTVLQKRDGTHMLCVWREVEIWKRQEQRALDVDPIDYTIALGTSEPARRWRRHRPGQEANNVGAFATATKNIPVNALSKGMHIFELPAAA